MNARLFTYRRVDCQRDSLSVSSMHQRFDSFDSAVWLIFLLPWKKMEWIGIRSKRDRKEGKNSLGIWDALWRQRGGIGHCPRQMKRKTERGSMIWSFEGFELVSQTGGGLSFQNSCFIMPTRSVSHSTRDLFHGKQDKKSAKSFAISGKNRPVSKSEKSSEKKSMDLKVKVGRVRVYI